MFGSNVATGDWVACVAFTNSITATVSSASLSGSSPTSGTLAAGFPSGGNPTDGSAQSAISEYFATANAGSTKTVTINWGNSPEADLVCEEITSVTGYQTGEGDTNSSGTALETNPGITTSHNNVLLVAGGGSLGTSPTYTQGSGFTIRGQINTGGISQGGFIEDKSFATSGSTTTGSATS